MSLHILKILWNRRKSFFGIFFEQTLVFIILMLCAVSVAEKAEQYHSPGLLRTDNTVHFGYMFRQDQPTSQAQFDEMARQMQHVVRNLRQQPYVSAISSSYGFLPYLRPGEFYSKDSVTVDQRKIEVSVSGTDADGWNVLRPVLIQGEWLTDQKLSDGSYPMVITRQLAEIMGWEQAVGRKIQRGIRLYTVTGMIEGMKVDPFEESAPAVILSGKLEMEDHGSMYGEYGARLNPDMQDDFFTDYMREFRKIVTLSNVEPIMGDMSKNKNDIMVGATLGLIFCSIPTVFFLVFGFIGTFGLFWLYSSKRVGEFALRRAVGATKVRLVRLVVTESVVLTLLAAVPGLLLAAFIYTWNWTVVVGVGCTLAIMLIFSVFSSWYPAWKVSHISPAEALHNE
ncbi:MAG: ABC transporter permease [Rikenellaceae bacterium]|nr:ABC transporter permease [Rikenellaceae bacterium]